MLRSVASFVIIGTAALTVLSVLEINLAPLLASAGVAGVAIGFGARNLVTDFLSGVFMILEDQYGVGDAIDAGVATGTVIEVGLRVTKLRGDNGEIWYVRNGEVKRIGNLSQGWATAVVDVQVAPRRGPGAGAGRDPEAGAEAMAKAEPWNEQLWEPVEVLGLSRWTPDTVVIQAQAKTMPGKARGGGARTALAHQAGLRRGGHPDGRRCRARRRGGRGPGGRGRRAVGPRRPAVPAVGRRVPAHAAGGRIRRSGLTRRAAAPRAARGAVRRGVFPGSRRPGLLSSCTRRR